MSEPERTRLQIRLIQLLALGPLIIGGVALLLSPAIREVCADGWHRLVAVDPKDPAEGVASLREWGLGLGGWAPLATFYLMVVQGLAAPIPAVFVTATNSLLFGWFWGGLYSIFTATVAGAICFALGRVFGQPVLSVVMSERARERTDRFMKDNGGLAILMARLLPVVPFDPISYLAGVTRMPLGVFFLATFVGQVPAGFAYSYAASRLEHGMAAFWGASIAAFLGLLVFGLLVTRLVRNRRSAQAAGVRPDNEEGASGTDAP